MAGGCSHVTRAHLHESPSRDNPAGALCCVRVPREPPGDGAGSEVTRGPVRAGRASWGRPCGSGGLTRTLTHSEQPAWLASWDEPLATHWLPVAKR